jgi:nucleotide-binding universal stress UspA family protein
MVSNILQFYHPCQNFALARFSLQLHGTFMAVGPVWGDMETPSHQWHIAVATDFTEVARHGTMAAAWLAEQVGGRVTVISVEAQPSGPSGSSGVSRLSQAELALEHDRLGRWASPEMGSQPWSTVVRTGLPGIEISRYAEEADVDLIVLVRKPRSKMSRVISGDTVDSVVRRSVVPCLVVPPIEFDLRGFLVALDGTERGLVVLRGALELARATHQPVVPVTVEPRRSNEPAPLAAQLPTGRSMHLEDAVMATADGGDVDSVLIRRGVVVEELLQEVEQRPGFVIAIGYHRGGPPGVIDAGSIGRMLVHQSPAPILTIPM